MTPQWVSPDTAANFLGVSTKTIYRLMKNNTLPYIKLSARTVRVDLSQYSRKAA